MVIIHLEVGEQTEDVYRDYNFMMYYMELPMEIRANIGHQFSDFIKGCTFRGTNCLNQRYTVSFLRKYVDF